MNAAWSTSLEWTIVAMLVAFAGAYSLLRLVPRVRTKVLTHVVQRLDRPGRAAWLRRIGALLAPDASGCGSGCGACSNCGPAAPSGEGPQVVEQVIEIHRSPTARRRIFD